MTVKLFVEPSSEFTGTFNVTIKASELPSEVLDEPLTGMTSVCLQVLDLSLVLDSLEQLQNEEMAGNVKEDTIIETTELEFKSQNFDKYGSFQLILNAGANFVADAQIDSTVLLM